MLSFGGTKNGLQFGGAVVVFRSQDAVGLPYLRRMNKQLASKMRFVSAQLVALLEGDLWIRSARQSNAMATRFVAAVGPTAGAKITQPVQANAVFAISGAGRGEASLPQPLLKAARRRHSISFLVGRVSRGCHSAARSCGCL